MIFNFYEILSMECVGIFENLLNKSKETLAQQNEDEDLAKHQYLDHVRVVTPWGRRYIQFSDSEITDLEKKTLANETDTMQFCSTFLGFRLWSSSKKNLKTNAYDLYSAYFNFTKFAKAVGMPWWNEHPIKLALYSIGITAVTAGGLGYWLGSRRS
jgi:hypothetical protein